MEGQFITSHTIAPLNATEHPTSAYSYRLRLDKSRRGVLADIYILIESRVIQREAGVEPMIAGNLVKLGQKVRNLRNHGLEEGVSTRLLIYAGTLIKQGVPPARACDVAVARPITDDADMQRAILELVKAIF